MLKKYCLSRHRRQLPQIQYCSLSSCSRVLFIHLCIISSLANSATQAGIPIASNAAVLTESKVVIPVLTTTTTTTTTRSPTIAIRSTISTSTDSTASATTFIRNDISNNNFAEFSTSSTPPDKQLVERLIKQWAPVVWLAPEEKFMPLGVDEFLSHVHPMDKSSKSFIPGMPIGDQSKKSYLVTNAEIDELLNDEKSFIYGRNPNELPVPIYAVVTLCNKPTSNRKQQENDMKISITSELLQARPNEQFKSNDKKPQLQPFTITSTRGPYIPVSINPFEPYNDTIRRSSRLYPVFQRLRRNVPPLAAAKTSAPTDFNLALGETNVAAIDSVMSSQLPTTIKSEDNIGQINNFIANLADNVKFSTFDNEMDNNINFDNNFNERKQSIGGKISSQELPGFHVTYWMFYPYSQGKTLCTVSLGPLGSIPFPAVYGYCLGRRKDIGSHIGDWEHMSLFFNGAAEPESMYVSAHDAGAYYTYNHLTGSFEFKRQETRKGILQRPNFPKTVTTFNNHPVLFAAKGSHGLWTAPGKHRFVKVARLYDINGFGTPWNTWKSVNITYENSKSYGRSLAPTWLSFKGKWGNPKSKCHPFRRIGLNFCEYTDGPTGIPLKEHHFQCGATYR